MAEPIAFTHTCRVPAEDIGRMDHVSNVTVVRYVQDVAAMHWLSVASDDVKAKFVWVVRRHEIDYFKQLLLGDELAVRTWVGEMSGASWDRHTEIVRQSDSAIVVRARTVWVLIDPASGRPRRVDPAWANWLVK